MQLMKGMKIEEEEEEMNFEDREGEKENEVETVKGKRKGNGKEKEKEKDKDKERPVQAPHNGTGRYFVAQAGNILFLFLFLFSHYTLPSLPPSLPILFLHEHICPT